jgi:tetratricopeptide (TPR) repeat protein
MADKNIPKTTYDKVARRLMNGQLQSALTLISKHCVTESRLYSIGEDAETLQKDYDRMLNFLAKGTHDPKLQEQHDILLDRAWTLAEKLYDAESPATPPFEESLTALLEQLQAEPNNDQRLNHVFEQVVESRHLAKPDRKALHQTILDENIPEYVRATLLSSITLHLTQNFDARMVEDLYTYTLDDQPVQLQMQAWITLVFVALIHSHRIEHLPRLREQYQFICESAPDLLFNLQISLLQCREAFTFDKKLHKIINQDGEEEELSEQERVREFFEFITEGIDTTLSMFSHLKKISFFSAPGTRHHWLEPFCLEQPDIKAILDENPKALPWSQMLLQSVAQCDTDKYGSFLTMQAYNKDLMATISEKLEEKGMKFDEILPPGPLYVMRNYLHDLFRYCNMHPKGETMRYPLFDRDLDMSQNKWLCAGVNRPDQLKKTAEFLFRKERWDEACVTYTTLLNYEVTEETLQKLYYSMAHSGRVIDNRKAMQTLIKCNILFPGNKWTLRHLADAYHGSEEYQFESLVLHEALEHYPDDPTLLMRMGRCLTSQDRIDEAIEILYKADIKKEGQLRVHCELAKALFLSCDHTRAEKFIRMVLSRPEPGADDWLLGGHIALQGEDIPLAIERYKKIDDYTYAYNGILADKKKLIRAGIPENLIQLVMELLLRELHNEANNNNQE